MSELVSLPFAEHRATTEKVLALLSSRRFQLMTLLVYALFLNREGVRVPSGNELVYLLYVYKAWHPHFMAGDWTFLEPTAGHGFFNFASGWLTLLMPLEWAAWAGRFICWTLTFIGLFRLGEHFRISSWKIWLGILFWMMQRQALPTTPWTEWVIGSFEAKCPAYICLIFALDAALRCKCIDSDDETYHRAMQRQLIIAGLLAGLSFSFHSAVGMWGGAAIGWTVLWNLGFRRSLVFGACAVLAALPGLISSLPLITGPHAITAEESRFLVTTALPLCLDPFAMARPYVALLSLMLLFAAWYRWQRGGRTAAMIFQFQLALGMFCIFGFVARALGRFDLVKLYPIRVFAVLAILFFSWQLLSVVSAILRSGKRSEPALLALGGFGAVIFLALPSPVARVAGSIASHLHSIEWTQTTQASAADDALESTPDFRAAGGWIVENTPENAVVIAPPSRADAFYFIRRPLIANWHAYRYDAMGDWQKRVEALTGDLSHLDPNDADIGNMDLAARSHYRNLSVTDILALQQRFSASWLISSTEYPFPKVFSSGPYSVYRLPR